MLSWSPDSGCLALCLQPGPRGLHMPGLPCSNSTAWSLQCPMHSSVRRPPGHSTGTPNGCQLPAGAVRAIFSAIDFSKDGSTDILVGRDDGSVEVYGMDTEQQPTLLWSINVNESVSSIQGGFITSPSTQVRGG